MRSISDKGLLELCEHEGIVIAPYRDSVGVWTYGVGHTASAGGLDPREMSSAMPSDIDTAIDRALALFRTDAKKYEARVNQALTVKVTQYEFDALVSWDFNTGGATWRHPRTGKPSRLIQDINSGNHSGDGFMGWLRPPEIRKRREAEQRLYLTGDYDHNGRAIRVYGTNGRGRLEGVLRVIDGQTLLERMKKLLPEEEQPKPPASAWKVIASLFRKGA